MLKDNNLIKYSKSSASGKFNLSDFIQVTFQAGTYYIDDFKAKI